MRLRELVEPSLKYKEPILIETSSDELDEGWKDTLSNLAIASAIGAGGTAGMVGKQAVSNYFSGAKEPAATVQQVQQAPKVDVKKFAPQAKKAEPAQAKPQVPKKIVVKPVTDNPLEKVLLQVAKQEGIKGAELAAFMAQCAHETMDFRSLVEFGGSLDFRKYDPKYSPKKAKALGNKHVGDGMKYKGRGFIQITGRYNYKKAGEELGLPLEKHPELAQKPEIAAKIAVWFWKHRVQPNVDNFHDVKKVTKPINPSMNGLQDRKENFKAYISAAEEPVTATSGNV
jgi:putative chitinase